MVLGHKYSSRFSEERTTITVDFGDVKGRIWNVYVRTWSGHWAHVSVDAGLISPWLTDFASSQICWSDRRRPTTLLVYHVANPKRAHRRDKLRCSKSPAGINAPPSLLQALVQILGSSETTQRRLLLRGSEAFNAHPFDNLWAIRKLLRLEEGSSRCSCHGRFRCLVSQHHWKTQRLCCVLCLVCRRNAELHSHQTHFKTWLKSNFLHSLLVPPCAPLWQLFYLHRIVRDNDKHWKHSHWSTIGSTKRQEHTDTQAN